MKCPEEIIEIMHEFLDDDIDERRKMKLRDHLRSCNECRTIFNELIKTVAFVKSTSNVQAPENFTEKLMANLPKEKKKIGVQRWLRNHPFIAAASLFLILMMGSFFSAWSENRDFSVSKQPNLIVKNHTVIVPKGKVVKGDVVVENGKLKIEGEVQGNVTVIHGEKYMASAGKVTGHIEEVNQLFDWIWYNIKKTVKDDISMLSNHGSPSAR